YKMMKNHTSMKSIGLKLTMTTIMVSVFAGLSGISAFDIAPARADGDHSNNEPTEGYDIHATVKRHDAQNLDHKMDHYCKLDERIVATCLLYSGDEKDAKLEQIEFIITDSQYNQLPDREKQNWHNHAVELTPERGEPEFVDLPKGVDAGELLETLQQTYGKVITVWDSEDKLPDYLPYVFQVDSPFALGQDENDDLEEEWETGDDNNNDNDNNN
ncbi:MAG: DUF1264 domain-containing protein, partial [Thermoproteota archaeon]|nr:DUF1264 domain-containing protein [Thermoproteota archaeon]